MIGIIVLSVLCGFIIGMNFAIMMFDINSKTRYFIDGKWVKRNE